MSSADCGGSGGEEGLEAADEAGFDGATNGAQGQREVDFDADVAIGEVDGAAGACSEARRREDLEGPGAPVPGDVVALLRIASDALDSSLELIEGEAVKTADEDGTHFE
ncbi:MAG TPA: hypothetical protein PLI95_17435 [Polyangiaceae bacterium]|nr:hypothetical protein [Polyangiaceae bacterium]